MMIRARRRREPRRRWWAFAPLWLLWLAGLWWLSWSLLYNECEHRWDLSPTDYCAVPPVSSR